MRYLNDPRAVALIEALIRQANWQDGPASIAGGRYLYPAFPYTAFTRTRDDDLQALYAYLMSQPPATDLHFPFNIRRASSPGTCCS